MRTQPAKRAPTPAAAAGSAVMRAIIQDIYGSADRLRLSEIEKPVIAADERYALLPVKAPQGTPAHTGHAVAGGGAPRRAGRKDLLNSMAKGGL